MNGLEGNFQAQPRVFGHDAKSIEESAVNTDAADGGHSGLTSQGAGYTASQNPVATTVSPAGGTGLTVNTTVDSGKVTAFSIATAGKGYNVNDTVSISGGTQGSLATFTITNVNIPFTEQRGAVIYNGNSSAQDIEIVTEAGNSVDFKNVQPGTVVGDQAPMLAIRLVDGDNCVAIY
mgnify:FL=1|tara:strand:- start:117 stop:647 length:531 start_codon:yes stop_codon:yes gene_type:complete